MLSRLNWKYYGDDETNYLFESDTDFKVSYIKKELINLKKNKIGEKIEKLLENCLFDFEIKTKKASLNIYFRAADDWEGPTDLDSWIKSKSRKDFPIQIKLAIDIRLDTKEVILNKNNSRYTSIPDNILTELDDALNSKYPKEQHGSKNLINKIIFEKVLDVHKKIVKGTDLFYREICKIEDLYGDRHPAVSETKFYELLDINIVQDFLDPDRYSNFYSKKALSQKNKILRNHSFYGLFHSGKFKGGIYEILPSRNLTDITVVTNRTNVRSPHSYSTLSNFKTFSIIPDYRVTDLKEYFVSLYEKYSILVKEDASRGGYVHSDELTSILGMTKKKRAVSSNLKTHSHRNTSVICLAYKLVLLEDSDLLYRYASEVGSSYFLRLAALSASPVEVLNRVYAESSEGFKSLMKLYLAKEDKSVRFIKGYDF